MEPIAFFLVFLVIIAFVAFPIWVIVRITGLSRELRKTRESLANLQRMVGESRVAPPPVAQPKVEPSVQAAVPVPPPILQPPPIQAKAAEPPASALPLPPPVLESQAAQPAPPQLPPQPQTEKPARAPSFNWEVFMGTKFLSWLGAVAAFLAVAFFLKYSIDHGLIPPIVRAAMGFVFGAGLVVGGLFAVRKTYPILGHALCAAGIVSLYGVTFACRALYHFPFFGLVPTFALMSLTTAAAFTLAVRLDGKFIAILGLLGGFLTPVLLSTGVDNPAGLFGYIALLNIGLHAVALHRRWDFLVALGALGTIAMQIGWAMKFPGDHNTLTAIIVCLVFDALFLAGHLAARRMKRESLFHSRSVAALVLVSFGFALYLATGTVVKWQPWYLLGFVFLADACVLAVAALDRRARDSAWLPALAGVAVFGVLAAWGAVLGYQIRGMLAWALAGYFVFAVLHTAFPLLLARMRPGPDGSRAGFATQLFAPLALLLVLIPVFRDSGVHWLVWPAILLIDFVAIVCAALTRSIVSVVVSLVLTLVAAAAWLCKLPAALVSVPLPLLLVTGGFAILFFAASLWLGRRIGGADKMDAGFTLALPALSSLLPFVLIVMMVARIAPADPTPVFGLALVLTVMALGLAKILKNEWLPACALAGVLAVCYAWRASVAGASVALAQQVSAATALGWFIGFYAIFAAFPFVFRSAFLNARGPWLSAAASGVLFFPLIYAFIKTHWPNNVMGLVPAAFALPALASLAAVLRFGPRENPRHLGRIAIFGGVALLFVTLIFPIQFSREWITIAWALEGAALLWLYTRVPHRALPWAGAALLAVAFARLALNPAVLSYHVRGDTPVLNWYLYTYGVAIACMFGGAQFLKAAKLRNRMTGIVAKILPALGAVLAFLLLNIEIADFFTEPGSRVLTLEFSGNFARDMSYTIAWALFALVLLVAGIWRRLRVSRYAALGLLAVVVLKLVFHDLAKLETLYRVGALFAVAVVMILASFLYQKYIAPREGGKTPPPPVPPEPPPQPPSES